MSSHMSTQSGVIEHEYRRDGSMVGRTFCILTSSAAEELAFSKAGNIQSVLRARLIDERLYHLLYNYFNCRGLLDGDSCEASVDGVVVGDDARDAGIGSDRRLSDVADIAQILAVK